MAQEAKDPFQGQDLVGRIIPSTKHFKPTFSDTDELEFIANRVIFNTSATLHYESKDGDEITFDFDSGQYDISVRQIYDTGTTYTEDQVLCLA